VFEIAIRGEVALSFSLRRISLDTYAGVPSRRRCRSAEFRLVPLWQHEVSSSVTVMALFWPSLLQDRHTRSMAGLAIFPVSGVRNLGAVDSDAYTDRPSSR